MSYGVYRDKGWSGYYLALDEGDTFVKQPRQFDELRRVADLANDGLALRGSGWRARLARRILRTDGAEE